MNSFYHRRWSILILGSLFFLACLSLPLLSVQAETVLRVSEEVTVQPEQKVDGDFYAAGNTIVMTGEVLGDILGVADTMTINGAVTADVMAAARSVTINEAVGDDVRVAAAEVTIGSDIAGDVFVAAGTLTILPTATIAGNVYIFGATATIDGDVAGSIYGSLERLTVNGQVGQNIDVSVPAGLLLGDAAVIGGDVVYKSSFDLTRGPSTEVGGTIMEKPVPEPSDRELIRSIAVPFFIVLFGALTIYLMGRRQIAQVATTAAERPIMSLAIGIAVLLLILPLVTVLVTSIIGAIVGFMFLFSTLFAMALAVLCAGVVLGVYIQQLMGRPAAFTLPVVAGGVTVWYALFFVPVVGAIVALTLVFMALGAQCQLVVGKLGVK